MAWVKLDDQFPDHPKVAAAGPLAGWLYVCGLAYCNRNLTDGFIPVSVAHRLTSFDHIGIELGGNDMVAFGDDVTCEWMAEVLVREKLWQRTKDGYRVHDYLDYQPSKTDVLKEREQWKKRQSRHRSRRDDTRDMSRRDEAVTHAGVTAGFTRESGSPVPVPVPKASEGSNLSYPTTAPEPAPDPPRQPVEDYGPPELTRPNGAGAGSADFQQIDPHAELRRLAG